jgi:FkbM family methyltransferase
MTESPRAFSCVAQARAFAGHLLLRVPNGLRTVRTVPWLGKLAHSLGDRLFPSGQLVWSRIRSGPAQGIWLELNPRTGQSYMQAKAELAVQEFIADQLGQGMVFYDLGANIGFFSLLAAKLVGPRGKVFSFEPDAVVFARLKRNIERNGFLQVTPVNKGVWSTTGTATFLAADASSPDRGLGKLAPVSTGDHLRVQCIALDDFIAESLPPTVVKVDVEGAEMEVLRGAVTLFGKHRPSIVCEVHSEENRRDAERLLGQYGYSIRAIDSSHIAALP